MKDECGSSKDCQVLHPNKPVCKEEFDTKTCAKANKCKCGESELCSSDENCVPSNGICESMDDCDNTKVCRNFIPGGSKTCVGYTIEEQSLPCFTNKGCQGEEMGKLSARRAKERELVFTLINVCPNASLNLAIVTQNTDAS